MRFSICPRYTRSPDIEDCGDSANNRDTTWGQLGLRGLGQARIQWLLYGGVPDPELPHDGALARAGPSRTTNHRIQLEDPAVAAGLLDFAISPDTGAWPWVPPRLWLRANGRAPRR